MVWLKCKANWVSTSCWYKNQMISHTVCDMVGQRSMFVYFDLHETNSWGSSIQCLLLRASDWLIIGWDKTAAWLVLTSEGHQHDVWLKCLSALLLSCRPMPRFVRMLGTDCDCVTWVSPHIVTSAPWTPDHPAHQLHLRGERVASGERQQGHLGYHDCWVNYYLWPRICGHWFQLPSLCRWVSHGSCTYLFICIYLADCYCCCWFSRMTSDEKWWQSP